MSKPKRIVVLILSFVLLSGVLSGCEKEEETGTVQIPEDLRQTSYNQSQKTALSSVDFLKDGKSDYVIVIPDEADEYETVGAEDLQLFVEKASGAKLEIVAEKDAPKDGKCIYIGAVKAADEAGIMPTYETTKQNGYQIKLVGDDCYLRGYTSMGSRNAVYEFLDEVVDYEIYAWDEIYVADVKTAKMPAFDKVYQLVFDWRNANYGDQIRIKGVSARMQLIGGEEVFVTGNVNHNSFTIVDPYVYDFTSDKYKDWYSPETESVAGKTYPVQLCYSNEEMMEQYIKNLIDMVKDAPQPAMMIGQQDNHGWCTCDECAALKEKYGTNGAVMVQFTNKVQAALDAWFAENKPGVQPTRLVMFAYNATVEAPAKFNESKGKWEPIDETVKLNDNSSVMIAPAGHTFDKAIVDTDLKDPYSLQGTIAGWASVTKYPFVWMYTLYFTGDGGMLMADTIEIVKKNYQYLRDIGTLYLIDQSEHYANNYSAWGHVKGYVGLKMSANPELHVGELLDDFFVNYYGPASDIMQALFNEQREYMTYLMKQDPLSTAKIGSQPQTTDYWKYNQLQHYLGQINQAFEAIKPLAKTDPERYTKLYDRILTESVQYRYLTLQLYYMEYEDQVLLQNERIALKNDCERLGITRASEQISMKTIYESWGLG
ncbi:MAG: DUF4838 domain-containing protein [Oscillospiraceae bacterium]|nr:DUF4838 domain-containing protein [Oscillospiraceae bacterium]